MVRQYDDVLPSSYCKELIRIFENSSEQEFINDDNKPCFTQINLNRENMPMVKMMIPIVRGVRTMYQQDTKSRFLPEIRSLEEFRIKRYLPNGEERFDEHVDVADYASARRAVAFLFYLNDNDGVTHFTRQRFTVRPKTGKVVVFPPTWAHPHYGAAPTLTKYILSTYIHYG